MSFCISEECHRRDTKPVSSARRFAPRSIKPLIFRLSRRLSVTYWPRRGASLSAILLAMLAGIVPQLAGAAPTGGKVVAGTASVTQPTASSTQIQQTSQNAIINWQSFSIAAGESVRFVQPNVNAIALNRVIGADPSRIFGTLSANGQVFLVNQAGVYFAKGANVDVGGLVATSMNISDTNFLARKFVFISGDSAGAVSNDGQLRGAYVTLAAPQVVNSGEISTMGGTTALAAGARLALDLSGDRLVSMSVDAAAANAAIVNSGSITADSGQVFMTARSANAVLDTVINTTGMVRASAIVSRGGKIMIDGGDAGAVTVNGTLAATGTHGGTVEVLGDRVALQSGARIDVSGDTGGGRALVGGDFHGAGAVRTASFTQVDKGAVINADARIEGNGGEVAVWANQDTTFGGRISAAGGAHGGDGGFIETSGKRTLAFSGAVNTSAARGATGTLLLDPTDITISNAPSSVSFTGDTIHGNAASSNLLVTDLTTALASTNVIVDTSSGFGARGNIDVHVNVSYNSANSLTLKADNNITAIGAILNGGTGAIALAGGGAISTSGIASNGEVSITGTAGGSSKAGSVALGDGVYSGGAMLTVQSYGPVTTGNVHGGTGTVKISSSGDVNINGIVQTYNASDSAIVISAGDNGMAGSGSGGNINVIGGSVFVGTGGRATLYTGSVAGSTGLAAMVGIGEGRFRYNSDPSNRNFAADLGAGVNAVYREQPTANFIAAASSITYGDAAPAVSLSSPTGLQNGDTAAQVISSGGASGSIAGPLSSSGHLTAGTHLINVSGNAIDQLGYSIAYAPGAMTVAQKALSINGLAVPASKTYDATTAAVVSGTGVLNGRVTGDLVSLSGAATGTYNSKNVASANSVTFSGLSLQGADAANYTVAMQAPAAATITAKAVAVGGLSVAASKVYDGTTNAIVTGTATLAAEAIGTGNASDGKVYAGDGMVLTGVASGAYNSKNVVGASIVTVGGLALAGAGFGNYSLSPAQFNALITPKLLSMSGLSVPANKADDGTLTAIVSGTAALAAKEAVGTGSATDGRAYIGDTVAIAGTPTGIYNSADPYLANTVTVGGLSLVGVSASNYGLNNVLRLPPKLRFPR